MSIIYACEKYYNIYVVVFSGVNYTEQKNVSFLCLVGVIAIRFATQREHCTRRTLRRIKAFHTEYLLCVYRG